MLAQTKESSDLGGTLGTESLGIDNISQARDFTFTLLDDGKGQDRKILSNNAATDGLALALTGSSRSVAGVAVGEEEFDTGREHL